MGSGDHSIQIFGPYSRIYLAENPLKHIDFNFIFVYQLKYLNLIFMDP